MRRTVSIKLCTTEYQGKALVQLQKVFNQARNDIVLVAVKNRCWNRVDLHHLSYYQIRFNQENEDQVLGSQMVCNAIKAVCDAYKVLKIRKDETVPKITFRQRSSIHYDKRTYSIQGESVSLYTISGRVLVPMKVGEFQRNYLQSGRPKEAELILRNGQWFFNLVLEMRDTQPLQRTENVLGVDLGENNLAATSTGKLFGGCELRHERDCALALRGRLQSNGSESSRQLLKKISGKEARHVKHVNHIVSKELIKEAQKFGCDTIAMESLTNIRRRIKARKRVRSRLHRWPWAQLQDFVVYKARAVGIKVIFVNPAYTSQTCADCGRIGIRYKHKFECKFCGIQRHSDLNASRNIRRIAVSADIATGTVNYPHVAVTIN